ncbi:MAG: ATP-dependent metallopeptidase FtsH/Yme1/Tma family protein, partial [Ruminococcus sp.]
MEEMKPNKKPYIWYWVIAIAVFILLNMFVFPNFLKHPVTEVGYDTLLQMADEHDIGSVNIDSTKITFTNKEETEYFKTGLMEDPWLVDRLYKSGAKFKAEIITSTSPLAYFLISYVLPLVLMIVVFRMLT